MVQSPAEDNGRRVDLFRLSLGAHDGTGLFQQLQQTKDYVITWRTIKVLIPRHQFPNKINVILIVIKLTSLLLCLCFNISSFCSIIPAVHLIHPPFLYLVFRKWFLWEFLLHFAFQPVRKELCVVNFRFKKTRFPQPTYFGQDRTR